MNRVTALIAVFCGGGFAASQSSTVDAWLSHFFAVALPVAGGLALLVAGVRAAWGVWRDWMAMGPPDLGPIRRTRADEREETEPFPRRAGRRKRYEREETGQQ